MKIDLQDDALMERAIARGVREFLEGAGLVERIAELVLARFQFLDYAEAGAMLNVTERTISELVNGTGRRGGRRELSKVTLAGVRDPRVLLSEVLERVRAGLVLRAGLKQDELPLIYGLPESDAGLALGKRIPESAGAAPGLLRLETKAGEGVAQVS